MKKYTSDIAFSPAVKKMQEQLGSRKTYERVEQGRGWASEVTPVLEGFIAERESFYFATANSDGQPYIQHRGGPKGFLKVLDKKRLAFADFFGNRQYISIGNLSENDKVHLFLMDYPNQTRIKVWGQAKVVDNDPELLAKLTESGYKASPERVIVIEVEAWDVNCPQHIIPRYTVHEIQPTIDKLKAQIKELEAQLAEARNINIR